MLKKDLFRKYLKISLIAALLLLASCSSTQKVGFDIDDTLLFSTPAFTKGFDEAERFSEEFWFIVNQYEVTEDMVKVKAEEILKEHLKNGDEVFVITARKGEGGEKLKDYIVKRFNIKRDNIYFEPFGKIDRIKSLGLAIFYGDADSDISDAIAGGAKGIRILRSPDSSNKGKYNPGKFNEEIIKGSE